jgi:Niemann-Pick C1 protein
MSAVVSSIGLFSYFGQPVTLIIVEVIPFLVLAVGVDNIFILVQAFQRHKLPKNPDLRVEVGNVLGSVAPSMLLTGLAESIAFFLGALTSMPAVRSFSLFAGMAIFLDFLLQVTFFVALLYWDARRQFANRTDVLCCIPISVSEQDDSDKEENSHSYLYCFFRDYYSHFLLHDIVRAIVMIVFVGGFAASIVGVNHLHVGLDQKLSMPKDSYLQDYFREQAHYARVGPPVYFVVKSGVNYSDPEEQNKICSLPGCDSDSLTAQLSAQATIKQYSKIANPPNSWLDDYLIWVSPNINCCRIYEESGKFCSAKEPMNATYCEKCLNQSDLYTCFSPFPNIFYHYLHYFLKDNPGIHCAKGGHAAYQQAIRFKSNTSIESSYFSTYHTPLAKDTDFIDALKRAREISKNLTLTLNGTAEVFPYSLVYVYYEQYLSVARDAAINLGLCAAAIFVVVFLLMGFSLSCAIIVTTTVAMIVVDLMGVMYLWHISFNAVSVVNLVMVGSSVRCL